MTACARRAFADPNLEAAVDALARTLSALFDAPGFGPEKLEATERRLLRHLPQAIDDLGLAMEAGPVSLESLPESLQPGLAHRRRRGTARRQPG